MTYQLIDTSGAQVEGDELQQRLARLKVADRRANWRDQGHKVAAPQRAPYGHVTRRTKRAPRPWVHILVAIGGVLAIALWLVSMVIQTPAWY